MQFDKTANIRLIMSFVALVTYISTPHMTRLTGWMPYFNQYQYSNTHIHTIIDRSFSDGANMKWYWRWPSAKTPIHIDRHEAKQNKMTFLDVVTSIRAPYTQYNNHCVAQQKLYFCHCKLFDPWRTKFTILLDGQMKVELKEESKGEKICAEAEDVA